MSFPQKAGTIDEVIIRCVDTDNKFIVEGLNVPVGTYLHLVSPYAIDASKGWQPSYTYLRLTNMTQRIDEEAQVLHITEGPYSTITSYNLASLPNEEMARRSLKPPYKFGLPDDTLKVLIICEKESLAKLVCTGLFKEQMLNMHGRGQKIGNKYFNVRQVMGTTFGKYKSTITITQCGGRLMQENVRGAVD